MSSYLTSERHFRLYESYLRRIVDAWPTVVTFEPVKPVASVATLETRIRICKNALKVELSGPKPTWDLGDFPVAKFLQIVDEIVVSSNVEPSKVACGPEDMLQKRAPINFSPAEVQDQVIPRIELVNPSLDLVVAVVVLHHYRLLSEPSTIKTGFDINSIITEKQYDVAIEKEGDVYTIL